MPASAARCLAVTMFRWLRLHWFRQCTASIHSACNLEPQPNVSLGAGRKRAFVVSPPPEVATFPSSHLKPHRCQPRKQIDVRRRCDASRHRMPLYTDHHTSPHEVFDRSVQSQLLRTKLILSSSVLSFLLAAICSRSSHHSRSADGLRLPCRT